MKKPIYIIVAVDEENGIGKDGKMPWSFRKELKHFSKITKATEDPEKTNLLIMGRNTWESLPDSFKPLPGRRNAVLTRTPEEFDQLENKNAENYHSFEEAITSAGDDTETIFIIGGGQIYKQGLELEDLTGLYLTKVHKTYDCDTFFPQVPSRFSKQEKLGEDTEDGVRFEYFKIT